jgi:phytoene dehydrogenase-like protein
MKIREQYDWVVLGDDPGALLSACLAARLGLSVLVVELGDRVRLGVSPGGQVFDPESNSILGLGRHGAIDGLWYKCLLKAGMTPAESERIRSPECSLEVVTPSIRLRLERNADRFLQEWMREQGAMKPEAEGDLPGMLRRAAEGLLRFWGTVPERLTWVSKTDATSSRIQRPARGGVELAEALASLKGFAARRAQDAEWLSPESELSPEAAAAPVLRAAGGAFAGFGLEAVPAGVALNLLALSKAEGSYVGGMSAFRDLLRGIAIRSGAHVPAKTRCSRIFIQDGRLVGVQLSQRGNVIAARGGVLGASLAQAREVLSVSGREWPRALKASPEFQGWKFPLALTVREEGVPPGLPDRLVWVEEGAPVLEIELASPSDHGLTEPEHRLLFARTTLPTQDQAMGAAWQRQVAGRIFRQLAEIFPFLEYHVVRIYPDFRTPDLEPFTRCAPWNAVGALPLGVRAEIREGVGYRSGVDGLFVASAESYPELGTFGPLVAALESTAWIAHRSALPGPLA